MTAYPFNHGLNLIDIAPVDARAIPLSFEGLSQAGSFGGNASTLGCCGPSRLPLAAGWIAAKVDPQAEVAGAVEGELEIARKLSKSSSALNTGRSRHLGVECLQEQQDAIAKAAEILHGGLGVGLRRHKTKHVSTTLGSQAA